MQTYGGSFPVSEAGRWFKEVAKMVFALVPDTHHDRIMFAAREVLANAITASEILGETMISFEWALKANQLSFQIVNYGVRFIPDPRQFSFPGLDKERGRGIPITRLMSDRIVFANGDNSTVVVLFWDLEAKFSGDKGK